MSQLKCFFSRDDFHRTWLIEQTCEITGDASDENESAWIVSTYACDPVFFAACRHLKLVRPSLRLTISQGTYGEPRHSNCHDVTFLDPPLTNVSYACVREQMFKTGSISVFEGRIFARNEEKTIRMVDWSLTKSRNRYQKLYRIYNYIVKYIKLCIESERERNVER